MRRLISWVCLLICFFCLPAGNAHAEDIAPTLDALTCPDADVLGAKLFNGICWSCIFPIRVSGITLFGGSGDAPPDAADTPICVCQGDLLKGELPRIGLSLGFWQPTRLIEVVRRPLCFPTLEGTTLPDNTPYLRKQIGGIIGPSGEATLSELGFYNFHYYSFPLLTMLELLGIPECNVGGYSDLDVLIMGEAFPNWYDDQLSAIVNPEVALFANPAAIGAQILDCAGITAGRIFDEIFWSAGCWGSMYPFTGNVLANESPVRGSSLVAARALAMLARLGIIERTVGDDVLCESEEMPILKKGQYKMQLLFPVNESKGGVSYDSGDSTIDTTNGGTQVPEVDPSDLMDGCCHDIGKSTLLWGEWRSRPATGEDFVYVLWQWTDCCMGPSL